MHSSIREVPIWRFCSDVHHITTVSPLQYIAEAMYVFPVEWYDNHNPFILLYFVFTHISKTFSYRYYIFMIFDIKEWPKYLLYMCNICLCVIYEWYEVSQNIIKRVKPICIDGIIKHDKIWRVSYGWTFDIGITMRFCNMFFYGSSFSFTSSGVILLVRN